MIRFSINNNELKKALAITSMATMDTGNTVEGQCLFDAAGETLKILSTDKSTCFARAIVSVPVEGSGKFTADPTKILNLIRISSPDSITFIFHPETSTVEIHASEEMESFVSLPSLDPASFPDIEDHLNKAFEVKTLGSDMLSKGIRFIEGFLATGKSSGKFGNMFIWDGALYASNGDNMAGVFASQDFTGITELAIPGVALGQMTGFMAKAGIDKVALKTTSNAVILESPDGKFSYGFTKVLVPFPRMPLTPGEPPGPGWEVDKNLLMKKIGRLQLSVESGNGVELRFSGGKLDLVTKMERSSKESMACKGAEEATLLVDCWMLEKTLKFFEALFGKTDGTLMIHPGKRRIIIFSKGAADGGQEILFTCSALLALAVS